MRASAFFGLVATALALVWLASRYDFSDVSASMAAAEPLLLAAAVPFLVLSLAFRTARWRLLFGDARPPGWRNSFAALAAGYLFNNLLPSHAGQLVRSFLLGRKEGMAQSRVLGTVVLEKVFDLAVFVGERDGAGGESIGQRLQIREDRLAVLQRLVLKLAF